ncbi:Potassium channel protein [hydrothermal vent metagenome]|uniref:Potassium channel protein n=1 Tax=hydrothermal vent metagenome TaxID=652676 RepID=A0A1W1ELK2_9ZZZZ
MRNKNALIFGYNDYTREIEKNIKRKYKYIEIFKLDGEDENSFDLSDNWDNISSRFDMSQSVAFCVIENMAQNIFLTISLREAFKDLAIVALAQDEESADKLKLAGATKLLPSTQTTANVIYEILEKPIVTKVLHHILYEDGALKISEIKIENLEIFDKDYPSDIDWGKDYGILVLFIITKDGINEFIYSSKIKRHKIEKGDIFIVVGYRENIDKFRELMRNEKC